MRPFFIPRTRLVTLPVVSLTSHLKSVRQAAVIQEGNRLL
ncbi:hypothetical protein BN2476_230197 [Paraburkholderia piptadeniae]|uniref:Uncharacterized protein n=1 Tax=Paraburkholderia piptadeniae TaxID=1701573 RepID=A0A1N7RXC9_9BURK|nr:hypothetical protein BN2476_230197 [Paraburkholderia piptadeniae]